MSGKPAVGSTIGRLKLQYDHGTVSEIFHYGRLIGWHGREQNQPVIEYPDGKRETVFSLNQTNWKI